MVARMIIVPDAMPSRDENGRALPAQFKFFLPLTSTLAVVYADSGLTVPLAQPIISDDAGRWPQIWAEESTYFLVGWYRLDTGATIKTFTDVRPADDALLYSATAAEAAYEAAAAAAAEAAASAAEAVATIAELGDFSDAVAAAEAAAAAADIDAAAAAASAAAAAASAAGIDSAEILTRAKGYSIAFASLL